MRELCECGERLRYTGRGRPPRQCGACKRAYYEANKAKIAQNQRAYYEANKAKIAENQRAYREANKAKIAENQRAYREANKAKIAENKRAYYEANKAKIAENKRAYREANKAKIAQNQLRREARLCSNCGEAMRHASESGLCSFCESELAEAA